jgi:hypothetical protein
LLASSSQPGIVSQLVEAYARREGIWNSMVNLTIQNIILLQSFIMNKIINLKEKNIQI